MEAATGFTTSLFISGLAFDSAERMNEVRLGVLMGSILSGIVGYAAPMAATGKSAEAKAQPAE